MKMNMVIKRDAVVDVNANAAAMRMRGSESPTETALLVANTPPAITSPGDPLSLLSPVSMQSGM